MSDPVNAKYIKGPFRADFKGGYIFTEDGFMFGEVRGWGELSHGPDAEKIQDANLQFMVDALNEKAAKASASPTPPEWIEGACPECERWQTTGHRRSCSKFKPAALEGAK